MGNGTHGKTPTARPATPARPGRRTTRNGVRYVTAKSSLGQVLIAGTERGVCAVMLGDSPRALEALARNQYAATRAPLRSADFTRWTRTILSQLDGRRRRSEVPLDIQATAFQWTVWQYLQSIPRGETRSCRGVARAIGQPTAARAVGRACATNPVCLVVPCHRVVRSDGSLGGYRWGVTRKQRLLDRESGRRES